MSCMVAEVLFTVFEAFKKDSGLNPFSTEVVLEPEWNFNKKTKTNNGGGGVMNFVTIIDPNNAFRKREAIMVKVKKASAEESLDQCLQAIKRIFETNQDQQPVYGFATNGANWILVFYDGDKFKKQKGF